jgi:two-component system cell cycle sensor histidine kinase/response regulator CckA
MSSTRTVLVVDDDIVSRELLRGLLATEEYSVLFAENGTQALDLAARHSPDVVLLDVVMPGLDGFEVCRQLRANPALRQVPIVLLTALEGRDSRLRGLAAGADEFLNKPVDPIELRMRIRTITQLNRFRQLCDERARFEAAVSHSPDAIVLTDGQGRILNVNAAFTRLVTPASRSIYDCFPKARAEALKSDVASLESGRRIDSFETPLLLSPITDACADVTVVRLPWSEGVLHEFILRDITDRKRLEAQVLRLQRIELLGQLAGGVVHDVNNLLMAVIGNAEALESGGNQAVRDRVTVIRSGAERGAALLRRILMFARGGDQAVTPVDVAPVLRETAAIASKLLGEHILLDVELPADLPAILGDSDQLHQVVMNLCVNARDAMPGGGRLLLSAKLVSLNDAEARAIGPDATEGEFMAISVRDTGTGIPPEIRDRLFDPFFTTKPRETATGLGLATVLRVMKRHHGFVGFETEMGGGTCFTCYFPSLLRSNLEGMMQATR